MDKSEVKAIVDRHLPFMTWDLQINQWDVEVEFGSLEGDYDSACVTINAKYEWAIIRIDPDACKGEEDVLRSLRHELLHIVAWPLEAFAKAVEDLTIKADEAIFDNLHSLYYEKAVLQLERMMDHGYRLPLGKRPDYEAPPASPYDGDPPMEDRPIEELRCIAYKMRRQNGVEVLMNTDDPKELAKRIEEALRNA